MPNVPSYQTGQVQNSDLPSVRFTANATAADFGGVQGANLERLGAAGGQAAQQAQSIAVSQQEDLNNNYVRDALANAGLDVNKHLAENVYNKKGFDAVNVAPDVQNKFKEISDRYTAGLQNDEQKQLFQSHFMADANQHMANVYTFQAKSREDLTNQTLLSENNTAVNSGVLYRNDPQQIQKNEFTIAQNTKSQWAGYGPQVAKEKADEAVSHYHSEIATAAAQDSAISGLQYLNKWGSKIDPAQYEHLKNTFEHQASSEVADQKAMVIAGQPGMTADQAQNLVDADHSIKDIEQKTLIMSNVKARLSEKNAADVAAQKKATESAWQGFVNDPNQNIPTNIPAADQMEMAAKKEKWAKDQASGDMKSNYGEILNVLATDPAQFTKMNLYKYRPGFDIPQSDWTFLKEQQDAILKGGNKKSEQFVKAMADAKQEAAQLPMFQMGTLDGEQTRIDKQNRMNQYLEDYGQKLMAVPDDQKMDWKTANDLKSELLAKHTINQKTIFGYNIPFTGTNVRQYQEDQNPDLANGPSPAVTPSPSQASTPQGSPIAPTAPALPAAPLKPAAVAPSAKDQIEANLNPAATRTDLVGNVGQGVDTALGDAKAGAKYVYDKTFKKVGNAIGDSVAQDNPNSNEMDTANKLHAQLQRAGVDTGNLNDAYQVMNHRFPSSTSADKTPEGVSATRHYVDLVQKAATENKDVLNKQVVDQREKIKSIQADYNAQLISREEARRRLAQLNIIQ